MRALTLIRPWRLAEPRPLPEPIPCRWALGLWALPPAVEATVRRQLGLP